MAFFKKLFQSSQARRSEKIAEMLTEIAVSPIATPAFEEESAFFRAYAVALGIFIPQYTVACASPGVAYPSWKEAIWQKPDEAFQDLATVLAWRSCLSAFGDIDNLFEEEDKESARSTLMSVAGAVFPVSSKAERLIQHYSMFERDPTARGEFFQHGYALSEAYLTQMTHLEIHAWMVNESLREAPLSNLNGDPAHVFGLQMYLAEMENLFSKEFKAHAIDLMRKHISAGRP